MRGAAQAQALATQAAGVASRGTATAAPPFSTPLDLEQCLDGLCHAEEGGRERGHLRDLLLELRQPARRLRVAHGLLQPLGDLDVVAGLERVRQVHPSEFRLEHLWWGRPRCDSPVSGRSGMRCTVPSKGSERPKQRSGVEYQVGT